MYVQVPSHGNNDLMIELWQQNVKFRSTLFPRGRNTIRAQCMKCLAWIALRSKLCQRVASFRKKQGKVSLRHGLSIFTTWVVESINSPSRFVCFLSSFLRHTWVWRCSPLPPQHAETKAVVTAYERCVSTGDTKGAIALRALIEVRGTDIVW